MGCRLDFRSAIVTCRLQDIQWSVMLDPVRQSQSGLRTHVAPESAMPGSSSRGLFRSWKALTPVDSISECLSRSGMLEQQLRDQRRTP